MRTPEHQKEYEAGYDVGFFDGAREQRRKDASLILPETLEITFRVRGSDDQYHALRRVLTFDLIGQSGGLVIKREVEHALAEVVAQTPLRELIEKS